MNIKPQDSLAMIMNPKRPERRGLALALAALAIAGLAYAAVSKQWLYNPVTTLYASYSFGPRGVEICEEHTKVCSSMSNSDLVELWRQQAKDQQLVIALVATINLDHVPQVIEPATLRKVGDKLQIGDAPPIDPADVGPYSPAAFYVDVAKQALGEKNPEVTITPHVARELQRASHAPDRRDLVLADQQEYAKKMAEDQRTSGGFAIAGWIAFVSCLVAAVSLLIAFVLVLAKLRLALPILPTTTALLGLMVAMVSGCVFVATKPGSSSFVGVSYGFWGFGFGVVLGIGSTLMLNRSLRPQDPDLLADSMNPDAF